MVMVIVLYILYPKHRFFLVSIRNQSDSGREEVAKPSILNNCRPARCEICGTAIAEPPGPRTYVSMLRNTEFCTRIGQILSVYKWILGYAPSVNNPPASLFQAIYHFGWSTSGNFHVFSN